MENELGKFLEELRGKTSLREVANKSGLSHTYIRDLELGINRKTKAPIRPSADTLKQLAKAYDYPSNELLKKAGYIEEDNTSSEDLDKKVEELLKDPNSQTFLKDYLAAPEDKREDVRKFLKFLIMEEEQNKK
ncbi:helix-turn-helix domain-containing protein [Bacillus sp. FJAT-45350]|uniref:helix-turn-helix domain-containing protein n=1 Tax=Bacillus sp. FJAT-45350 TaxID=2011014 RepID=UPI000BB8EF80|nr:helix-turn-helix transcriptional regulator [Bacillus sp. FJAT-45350]